jgi:hypothetical protein
MKERRRNKGFRTVGKKLSSQFVLCISRRKKYSLQIRFKFSDIFMFGCVRCEIEAKDSVFMILSMLSFLVFLICKWTLPLPLLTYLYLSSLQHVASHGNTRLKVDHQLFFPFLKDVTLLVHFQ